MCRVAGIIQLGENKITPQELRKFLLNMEYGGRDATGMAFITNDEIVCSKAKGQASRVIKEDFVDKVTPLVSKSKAILLHTRAATHGSPNNNFNNHPIIGSKYILVHNGVVETDTKYDARGETDTEQMLRSMEVNGLISGLNKVKGWVATIFADIDNFKNLYWYVNKLATLNSGFDAERQIWYLASTLGIIKESVIDKNKIEEYKIEDDTLYRCNMDDGKITIMGHPIVKSAYQYSNCGYYGYDAELVKYYSDYYSRYKKHNEAIK
jgi:hypothetical protein